MPYEPAEVYQVDNTVWAPRGILFEARFGHPLLLDAPVRRPIAVKLYPEDDNVYVPWIGKHGTRQRAGFIEFEPGRYSVIYTTGFTQCTAVGIGYREWIGGPFGAWHFTRASLAHLAGANPAYVENWDDLVNDMPIEQNRFAVAAGALGVSEITLYPALEQLGIPQENLIVYLNANSATLGVASGGRWGQIERIESGGAA